jgi:hypothetical protein
MFDYGEKKLCLTFFLKDAFVWNILIDNSMWTVRNEKVVILKNRKIIVSKKVRKIINQF